MSTLKEAEQNHHSRHIQCPYEIDNILDRLPITTVCYHARIDANTIDGSITTAPTIVLENALEDLAASSGSGVETLYFAREDDEYAGTP